MINTLRVEHPIYGFGYILNSVQDIKHTLVKFDDCTHPFTVLRKRLSYPEIEKAFREKFLEIEASGYCQWSYAVDPED